MNQYKHQYQQVPITANSQYSQPYPNTPYNNNNSNPMNSQITNKQQTNNRPIQNYKMTDQQFYHSLQIYKPFICYSGHGAPLLLINKGWYLSLGCVMVMNGIFLMVIFMFLAQAGKQPKAMKQADIRKFTIINISAMAAINLTYFLTQFMNPGIRNLSTISQQQYAKEGSFYCSRCNGNRTGNMQHCLDCGVCIQGLDHHCGFFSKCIGGFQKYLFYAFLCCMFAGFVTLLVTMTSNIGL